MATANRRPGRGGRSASGKTSLSGRLAAHIPGACLVHTDDIAWWHSFFGWTDLLISGVLEPVRRGVAVSYRPPSWEERGREGAVEVPAGTPLLLVEGVGSGRRELAPLLDGIVYLQVDLDEMERRDEVRIAKGEADADIVEAWQAEELPFMAAERPWERAMVIAGSTTGVPHDPEREVVISG
ncbi:MAG: hypothetical protein ABIM89_14715 [Mycobacteriales bacterium]